VTYRESTKEAWLGISRSLLENCTSVSEPVTRAMALAVLDKTPEADYSLAITGYLGPDAPPDQDGRVFVAVARRSGPEAGRSGPETDIVRAHEYQLTEKTRIARQHQAAVRALQTLRDTVGWTSSSVHGGRTDEDVHPT
jgi:nicotinamide-nucleotide amidase